MTKEVYNVAMIILTAIQAKVNEAIEKLEQIEKEEENAKDSQPN